MNYEIMDYPGIRKYLVFTRRDPVTPGDIPELPEGFQFTLLAGWLAGLRRINHIRRFQSFRNSLKTVLKIASGSRYLYFISHGGSPVSHGWITKGKCSKYLIGKTDCVIGSVFTEERMRGRGLSVTAGLNAMYVLSRKGIDVFYIDAYEKNAASLRMIEKMGFQGPIAVVPG